MLRFRRLWQRRLRDGSHEQFPGFGRVATAGGRHGLAPIAGDRRTNYKHGVQPSSRPPWRSRVRWSLVALRLAVHEVPGHQLCASIELLSGALSRPERAGGIRGVGRDVDGATAGRGLTQAPRALVPVWRRQNRRRGAHSSRPEWPSRSDAAPGHGCAGRHPRSARAHVPYDRRDGSFAAPAQAWRALILVTAISQVDEKFREFAPVKDVSSFFARVAATLRA